MRGFLELAKKFLNNYYKHLENEEIFNSDKIFIKDSNDIEKNVQNLIPSENKYQTRIEIDEIKKDIKYLKDELNKLKLEKDQKDDDKKSISLSTINETNESKCSSYDSSLNSSIDNNENKDNNSNIDEEQSNSYNIFNEEDDLIELKSVPKAMNLICELPHENVVCTSIFSKDGRKVFTGTKAEIKIWDISKIEKSSDGSDDNTNQLLQPLATIPCLTNKYIRSFKLFPDASTLIVGGETNKICVLDVEKGEIKTTFDFEAEACYALAISQDCKLCYFCCSNGNIIIWDIQSGEKVDQLIGHSDGVSCIDFSSDGEKLWTGGLDNTVRCWDIGKREEIENHSFDCEVFSIGCSPTDDWIAVGLEQKNIQIINSDMSKGYVIPAHNSYVLSLKFAHNGKWFVSTGKDNVVNCWSPPYGISHVKKKESSPILSCDISDDDRFVLTGSGDKKASLYDLWF